MAELIWVPNPPDLPKFLGQIPTLGVPPKANRDWLKAIGFKSSNHAYIPSVLGKLGFIDSSNVPTERWKKYRDKSQQRTVMADALRGAYSDLFTTYPEAHNKDTEALRNFFGSRSTASDTTLQRAVGTFKTLSALADFGAAPTAVQPNTPAIDTPLPLGSTPRDAPRPGLPSVNINIELHLPETDKAEVYENLFAAMRKHLFE